MDMEETPWRCALGAAFSVSSGAASCPLMPGKGKIQPWEWILAPAGAAVPSSVALQAGFACWSLAAQGFSLFCLQKQNKQAQGAETCQ